MKIIRGSELDYIPASHEDPNDPGVLKKVLATGSDFQRCEIPMLNWSLLRIGKSFKAHYHENMQEVFVILNGKVKVHVCIPSIESMTNSEAELTGGDMVIVDANEVHSMTNIGDEDVCYLVFGIASGKDGKTVVVE